VRQSTDTDLLQISIICNRVYHTIVNRYSYATASLDYSLIFLYGISKKLKVCSWLLNAAINIPLSIVNNQQES